MNLKRQAVGCTRGKDPFCLLSLGAPRLEVPVVPAFSPKHLLVSVKTGIKLQMFLLL